MSHVQTDALWASLSGGGKSQNVGTKEHNATAEAKTADSRPSTGIKWGSLCRPIAKAAVPGDKNRVRPCFWPPATSNVSLCCSPCCLAQILHCHHELGPMHV